MDETGRRQAIESVARALEFGEPEAAIHAMVGMCQSHSQSAVSDREQLRWETCEEALRKALKSVEASHELTRLAGEPVQSKDASPEAEAVSKP
jgi:hypothetical protein